MKFRFNLLSLLILVACLSVVLALVSRYREKQRCIALAREKWVISPVVVNPLEFGIDSDAELAAECIPCLPRIDTVDSVVVSFVDLTREQLLTIGKQTRLVDLALTGCEINDDDLRLLSGLKKIRNLHLDKNPITDQGLQYLAEMKKLRVLTMNWTQVVGPGLASLRENPHLRELRIGGDKLTDSAFDQLTEFTALTNLSIRGKQLTVDGYFKLAASHSLTALGVPDHISKPQGTREEKREYQLMLRDKFAEERLKHRGKSE